MTVANDQQQLCRAFLFGLQLYLRLVTMSIGRQPGRIFGFRLRRRAILFMPIDTG